MDREAGKWNNFQPLLTLPPVIPVGSLEIYGLQGYTDTSSAAEFFTMVQEFTQLVEKIVAERDKLRTNLINQFGQGGIDMADCFVGENTKLNSNILAHIAYARKIYTPLLLRHAKQSDAMATDIDLVPIYVATRQLNALCLGTLAFLHHLQQVNSPSQLKEALAEPGAQLESVISVKQVAGRAVERQ